MSTVAAEDRRDYQNRYYSDRNRATRNVKSDCVIQDPDRRKRCETSLRDFLLTYTAEPFYLGFSDAHERLISDVQDVIMESGRVCVAMPRGSGKSTILSRAIIWAAMYGHRRFPILVAASDPAYKRMLSGIKTLLLTNDRLSEDFPEVIEPIRELRDTAVRARTQHFDSEPTGIIWSGDLIRFGTTPPSIQRNNAGVCISGGGILGSLRGMSTTLRNGEVIRPDTLLFDDVQTRRSAASLAQNEEREQAVADCLSMVGAAKDISALMACTVICEDDLSCRLLDNERSPDWRSHRVKTLISFPTDMEAWESGYDQARRAELLSEAQPGEANRYYLEHRTKLDAGAAHFWPELVDPGAESAIQSSMNRYLADSRSFMSEQQNQPQTDETDGALEALSATELAGRTSAVKHGIVPIECSTITAFIDVQQSILFYVVMAWESEFAGHVIDYGTFPKRSVRYFTLDRIGKGNTLQRTYPGNDKQGCLRQGVTDLVRAINREWQKEDKSVLPMARILIDGGYEQEAVERGVRDSGCAVAMLAKGYGIGASRAPMSFWAKKSGQRRGDHWIVRPTPQSTRPMAHVDVNYWKTRVHQALLLPKTHSQAIRWYAANKSHHQMLADHCCAEKAIRVTAESRTIDEWRLVRPGLDNHLFDCLVGNMAAASMCGVRRPDETQPRPVRKPKRRMRVSKLNI